ncbi:segregation/condensation protein A [Desulfococcaceae bacterium HSG9]|nr:segregation/condensation protein A [Desulfococcaceae bacterium HSG9]
MSAPYLITIANIYEGPMDLLVHLIKKHDVDIYDIPIALITDSYLKYLEWLKGMNIDIAGDFIFMASILIHIKSKMLLPAPEDDESDPRSELTEPLLEHLRMKPAVKYLERRNQLNVDTFTRPCNHTKISVENNRDKWIQPSLFELIDAFQNVLNKISPEHKIKFSADRKTVKDRMSEIVVILDKKLTIAFDELFAFNTDKSEVVITFLAILEMVKLCLIRITQHIHGGMIRISYI